MASATPEVSRRRQREHGRDAPDSVARTSQQQHAQQAQRRERAPPLPEYQPPIAPLNAGSLRQLATLMQSGQFRKLQKHLRHASDRVTDAAGEVTEHMTDARVRYEKRRRLGQGRVKKSMGPAMCARVCVC